jgi:hypothetical protein
LAFLVLQGYGGAFRMTVYEEIQAERTAQDKKWGGPSHDDTRTMYDWIDLIHRNARYACGLDRPGLDLIFREQMIKVAALAVSAIEWVDRGSMK